MTRGTAFFSQIIAILLVTAASLAYVVPTFLDARKGT